ncbi:MAG: hypothetical protein NVSMB1_26380 [Polyangiales bacterium]
MTVRSEDADQARKEREADRMVFDALWSGVVNGWDDEERHVKFLDHLRATGAFAEGAKRYNALKSDPDRGEQANKRVTAIALLATHALLASKTPERTPRRPLWIYGISLLVCAALLAWAGWAWVH